MLDGQGPSVSSSNDAAKNEIEIRARLCSVELGANEYTPQNIRGVLPYELLYCQLFILPNILYMKWRESDSLIAQPMTLTNFDR